MRHVDGTNKKQKMDSAPILKLIKIPWAFKYATLVAQIKKTKNRASTLIFKVNKNSLDSQMRHVDGTHQKKLKIGIPHLFWKFTKIPWVSSFYVPSTWRILKPREFLWTLKIGVESIFFVFLMWAIVVHLEPQWTFMDFKYRRGNPIFVFYVCHQRGAYWNPGNFCGL